MFLFVGNKSISGPGGIAAFEYFPDGSVKLLSKQHDEVSAGFLTTDGNGHLMSVNERIEIDGIPGGQVVSFSIDRKSGELEYISAKNTYTTLPCYIKHDAENGRLFVCNLATKAWTLQLCGNENEKTPYNMCFDDAALLIFRILENGEIQDVSSYWVAPQNADEGIHSRLHCITYNAQMQVAYVCNTGNNCVHSIECSDRNAFNVTDTLRFDVPNAAPRRGLMHPKLPIVYFNSEKNNTVFVCSIDNKKLKQIQTLTIPEQGAAEDSEHFRQSDLAIMDNGKIMFGLDRKNCTINVYSVSCEGLLEVLQIADVGFECPRAMAISPDQKYLFVVCSTGKAIIRYTIDKTGKISDMIIVDRSISCPSSICFCP